MNGILLMDKPGGWTSHDVVAKLRGALHERRIGHAGTLDPMATGLLVVFVGKATKAVQFAEADRKRYIAGLRLGLTTDTQDITGSVLSQCPANVTDAMLDAALEHFRGEIDQVPPMYSAVKIDGQRLYKMARRGQEVERPARRITIHELCRLSSVENGEVTLDVTCSKGTYIRALCADIGAHLGCGGAMSALRRVEIDGNLEVVFVQPAEQRFVIGEKLRVPAVARPALRLKNLADFFIREKTVAAEISVFLAEALDNVNPVPVHIYCCNGNGNILFNEFLHKVNIFLLAVSFISAPPVAEAVARNERNGAAELKKFP